jgi:hypothetical protein
MIIGSMTLLTSIYEVHVLRTPVRHCELNPIELIWAQVKGFVAKNNTTFRLKDVKELTYAAFCVKLFCVLFMCYNQYKLNNSSDPI